MKRSNQNNRKGKNASVSRARRPQAARTIIEQYAFHEAGHAIVAAVLGVEIVGIRIGATTTLGEGLNDIDEATYRAVLLAGLVSSWLEEHQQWVIGNYRFRVPKAEWPVSLARSLTEGSSDSRKVGRIDSVDRQEAVRECAKILRAYWPAVQKVGEALLRDGHVPGDEVAQIVAARARMVGGLPAPSELPFDGNGRRKIGGVQVPLSQVKWERLLYPRKNGLDHRRVETLRGIAPHFKDPIVVSRDMKLVDGIQRVEAAKRDGVWKLKAEIYEYESDNAHLQHAVELNSMHGLQLSQEEKREWLTKAWGPRLGTELVTRVLRIPKSLAGIWVYHLKRKRSSS